MTRHLSRHLLTRHISVLESHLSYDLVKRHLLRFFHHLPTRHHFRNLITRHLISYQPTKHLRCNQVTNRLLMPSCRQEQLSQPGIHFVHFFGPKYSSYNRWPKKFFFGWPRKFCLTVGRPVLKPWMMGSSIPGPSSTIPSGPSECHGRPPTPSPYPENKLMRRCTWQYTYWIGNKLRNHSYSCYKSDNYLDDTRNVQVRRERWGDTRVSGSSRDEKSPSSSFNKESSTLPLDAKHVQAVPTLKAAEVRTITETLDEMPPSDPDPYCSIPSGSNACHTISSA